MPPPFYKKRKLNRHMTVRENAEILVQTEKYDVESWMEIISRSHKECKLEDQRYILNVFLDIFPTASRQWKYYIEIEMHHENYDIALELFKKCIHNKCYNVELYAVYIALCQRRNEASPKDIYLKHLNEAYKFVMKQIGQDIKSASLWRQYLQFLTSNSTTLNTNHNIKDITLEIRRIYQAVIQLPIDDCDKLWNEYISWEKSLDPGIAQQWYDKLKHVHDAAKRCCLERKRWRRGILMHIHIIPSSNQNVQERNYQQIQLWKRLLDWELLNKQHSNQAALCTRMEYTFRQSLMYTYLFPDIWLIYIEWTLSNRGKERSKAIYVQCLEKLPRCLLIHFKYLEFLETYYLRDTDQAYLDLLQDYPESALVYIQYLYFLRRSRSAADAQSFFIRTISRAPDRFWQFYVAESYIEEHMNNNRACAQRIFENGFKYFKDKPAFVLCYVRFLMVKHDKHSKNELTQIFENILPQYSPKNKDAQQIWKMYIKFHERTCDLKQLHNAEHKRNHEQLCNRIEKILNTIERFSFLDLLPVTKQYRDTLIDAQQKAQRETSQKLKALHTKCDSNIQRNVFSRIKMDPIKRASDDSTNFINYDMDDRSDMTMPDVSQLVAFRPGIRFLQKLIDDEEDEKREEENMALMNSLPPKIKKLLMDKLPPPQHTQLLKVNRNNTSMIDVAAFLTFMKLKFANSNDIL